MSPSSLYLKRVHGTLAALLAVAVLVFAAGCATMGKDLEKPDVSLVSIQMMSSDMFAQKFRVRVRVVNPNDLELPIRGLDYQIFLMGDSFAEGVSSDRFLVPALGEAEFDMIVTTNFVSSLGRLVSRVGGGKLENLDYEIVGKVLLEKGAVRKIPFNKVGKIDIAKATGAKPGQT
jgi:LEA14-like dessication related protein